MPRFVKVSSRSNIQRTQAACNARANSSCKYTQTHTCELAYSRQARHACHTWPNKQNMLNLLMYFRRASTLIMRRNGEREKRKKRSFMPACQWEGEGDKVLFLKTCHIQAKSFDLQARAASPCPPTFSPLAHVILRLPTIRHGNNSQQTCCRSGARTPHTNLRDNSRW